MPKLTGYDKIAYIKQCGKMYAYALYDEDIQPGDQVIVSGAANCSIWTVSHITDANDPEANKGFGPPTQEVITKVDTSKYQERIAKRKQADAIRKKLNDRRREIEKTHDDDYFANVDPEYKKLLDELKDIEDKKTNREA